MLFLILSRTNEMGRWKCASHLSASLPASARGARLRGIILFLFWIYVSFIVAQMLSVERKMNYLRPVKADSSVLTKCPLLRPRRLK